MATKKMHTIESENKFVPNFVKTPYFHYADDYLYESKPSSVTQTAPTPTPDIKSNNSQLIESKLYLLILEYVFTFYLLF